MKFNNPHQRLSTFLSPAAAAGAAMALSVYAPVHAASIAAPTGNNHWVVLSLPLTDWLLVLPLRRVVSSLG
jgi:hypothetical protein